MSECEICAEEFKQSQGTALSCGHNFCNDCWAGYLKIKIVGNVLLVNKEVTWLYRGKCECGVYGNEMSQESSSNID